MLLIKTFGVANNALKIMMGMKKNFGLVEYFVLDMYNNKFINIFIFLYKLEN